MEILQSIGHNTLSFLVEKIFYFKIDCCPKNKPRCLSIGLISSDVPLHLGLLGLLGGEQVTLDLWRHDPKSLPPPAPYYPPAYLVKIWKRCLEGAVKASSIR